MKQRLLLALLMLLTSVGLVKADITIKVPKDASLTITVSEPLNNVFVSVDGESKFGFSKDGESFIVEPNTANDQSVIISGTLGGLVLEGKATELTIENDELTTLKASGIGLKSLALSQAAALKTVDVSGNADLTTITGNALVAIESFNALNCALETFPNTVASPNSLKDLNLSGNKIANSGLDFSSYAKLENLNLANNKLQDLTVAGTLKTLDISGNQILGVKGIGNSTSVTIGTQKCTANWTAKANSGLNLGGYGILFNKPTLDWNNVTAVWERQKDGSDYEPNTNHGHARSGNAGPSVYFFYDAAKDNIYQDGTYRVTLTCSDAPGASIVISGIKIEPAEFNLEIVDAEHISVTRNGAGVSNGETVKQGETLIATYKYEGHALDAFQTKGLEVAEGSSLTANPASFKVAGRWNGNNNDIAPSINATSKDALLNVTLNTNTGGDSNNSIRVVAKKGNNPDIVLQEGKNANIPYQSRITITFKVNVGYEPNLSIGGQPITIDETHLVPGSSNTYEYVIDELITDNETIAANIVANKTVGIQLNLEGAITDIASGAFATASQIWIGGEEYSRTNGMNHGGFTPGSTVQVYFYLTRAAVDGSTPFDTPVEVEKNIIYDGKSYPIEKTEEFIDGTTDRYDGIYKYTATIPVSSQNATLTIRTKTLDKVTIIPTKGSATTNATEQRYVYDGKEHPFVYTTNPTGYHDDVLVEYKSGSGEYEKGAPIDAGTYTVKYWMEQTTEHCDVKPVEDWTIVIEPASVEITTEPKVDVQNGKYVITGGVAKANGKDVTNLGHFRVVKANGYDIDEKTQDISLTTAHTVVVRFTVEDAESRADDANYKTAEVSTTATINGQGTVAKYGVKAENVPSDITLKMYNGDKEITDNTEVPVGTVMKIVLQIPENYNNPATNVKLFKSVNGGTKQQIYIDPTNDIIWSTREFLYDDPKYTTIEGPTVFTVEAQADFLIDKEYVITMSESMVTYNGKEQDYPWDKITVLGENNEKIDLNKLNPQFTYTVVENETEYEVGKPRNAGTYKVYMTIPYQGTGDYKEYKSATKDATMIIKKVPTVITENPKPTLLPKNQPLSQSNLVGGVVKAADVDGKPIDTTIAGTFDWSNKNLTPEDGKSYDVTFIPDAEWAINYDVPTGIKVTVSVSDKNLITIKDPGSQVGTIVVTNATTGLRYYGEEEITEGTRLHIVVTPTSNFNFNYLSINGTRYTTTTVDYTVKADESVAIYADFSIIEPDVPDPGFDPNSQYLVTVQKASTNNRGFILGKEGQNGVYFEKPFEFTVSALEVDLDKLVVTGATKVGKGKYRIESVTENTTITVSLANPTELKVNIPREYKNTKGYLVGKVQVEGPADGKCYYGDQLTLVAYPESGVSFTRWSDSNREQLREITVTKDLELKAEFSGTPTGIEDIESASIYAGDGYIQVKNVVNADLTVVSISGRIQTKQQLSGDTQVRVPAGVYVVILESGQDVKRVKVIVR